MKYGNLIIKLSCANLVVQFKLTYVKIKKKKTFFVVDSSLKKQKGSKRSSKYALSYTPSYYLDTTVRYQIIRESLSLVTQSITSLLHKNLPGNQYTTVAY